MIKFKGYWYIFSVIALAVLSFFQYTDSENDSLDKTARNDINLSEVNIEGIRVNKKSPPVKKSQNFNINKHRHVEPEYNDSMLENDLPLIPPLPEEFRSMKKGVSIVSIEDHPIPQEFKDSAKRFRQQMEERGYADASENDVNVISAELSERNSKYLISPEEAAAVLVSEPIDLEGTLFEDKKIIGAVTGGAFVDGKWTDIARLFEFEEFGVVQLQEDESLAILLSEEAINEDVNGNPAMYTVQVSESGQSLTSISWVTDDKQYTVSMNKNASEDEKLKEDFINLARSLPTDTDFSSTDNLQ